MTPLHPDGAKSDVSDDSLPAATTTTAPWASASSIASWTAFGQRPNPPRLMLITFAGFGFGGTPAIGTPDAHNMPSNTSSSVPPHSPSTRTGTIRAYKSMLAMPMPLLMSPAMIPETNGPCHELGCAGKPPHAPASTQSPSSRGSASRPLPSRASVGSGMNSQP